MEVTQRHKGKQSKQGHLDSCSLDLSSSDSIHILSSHSKAKHVLMLAVLFFSVCISVSAQQSDLKWVDEGSLDFEVPPRGHKFFHKPMTVGYQIILDWETLNEKAVQFWICNPKWTGEMPPARSAIAYSGYSWKMYNYRFKATSNGEWSFIFYNDEAVPYMVSLHWVIFKEADAPAVKAADITNPNPRSIDFFSPKMLIIESIIFVGIVLISKVFLSAPKETARERRLRKMKKRRSKSR